MTPFQLTCLCTEGRVVKEVENPVPAKVAPRSKLREMGVTPERVTVARVMLEPLEGRLAFA
jgi:hypothetical protein